MAQTQIRTRFAPSPTGFLHIGSLRTALYAFAMARHNKGRFILRIEDTDQKREVPGAVKSLQDILQKFGLYWDEFYIQSKRATTGIYTQAALQLVSSGHAFYCQCQPKNAKELGFSSITRDPCRDLSLTSGAIKLKVPDNRTVSYYDFVHKKDISWSTNTVYDATLLKTDGLPTYHLAAMVDDLDMQVSHILRGHDWLPSTPIHLLIFEFLAGRRPEIGHLSDILSAQTGKKLSKRRDSVFCEQFLDQGYLPEAILNFVMLLGWAPKDNRELFTLDEFIDNFDVRGFQEANPRFLNEKLNWFNGQYIRRQPDSDLKSLLRPLSKLSYPSELIDQIIPLVKPRISLLSQFDHMASFFVFAPTPPSELLSMRDQLSVARDVLASCQWTKQSIEESLVAAVKLKGWTNSDFFMSLRLCITGQKVSPPLTESMLILGRQECLDRVDRSLNI